MSEVIQLTKINEVFFRVVAEQSALAEMSDYFTFKVPGAHFTPSYRAKQWDGRIHLLSRLNNTIYTGLIQKIYQFAAERGYDVQLIKKEEEKPTSDEIKTFLNKINVPFEIRDYQMKAFLHSIFNKQALILSPTASGKSLIIYLITRWYTEHTNKQALIIVPTLNLVAQMYKDFEVYSKNEPSFKVEEQLHQIYSGREKTTTCPVIISTWQSLHKMPRQFFENFGYVLIDEAHLAKADSLKNILTKCANANWRFGTTGTLDGSKCNAMVIEGLTGPVYKATTTKELMDQKRLADLKINCIVLKHPEADCKLIKKYKYADEIGHIILNEKRNKFIRNLTIGMKGNTLVLFQYVQKHGQSLFSEIKKKAADNRKVFFVFGGTDVEGRELVRSITEKEKDAIIVASVGVFSTGVNIKNLNNIIFASPSKSRIRVLQSIGRALRTSDTKTDATLYDIVDDLTHNKRKNFVLKHFLERVQIYDSEQFEYNIYEISL